MDGEHADDLLKRALIDAEAAASVALRVTPLSLSQALTVVFHGRKDLGTIQTYVAGGGRGAGSAIGADELLRVPCDLDLGDAESRDEAEEAYAEQATWVKIVGAAALQGVIFKVTRVIVDRFGARGFAYLTGIWPGEKRSDPDDD